MPNDLAVAQQQEPTDFQDLAGLTLEQLIEEKSSVEAQRATLDAQLEQINDAIAARAKQLGFSFNGKPGKRRGRRSKEADA